MESMTVTERIFMKLAFAPTRFGMGVKLGR